MHPDRVARFLSILGLYLLLTVLGLRVISLVAIAWQDRMGITNKPVNPVIPATDNFTLSPDGRQVIFQKQVGIDGKMGWFIMPQEGGPAIPTEKPQPVTEPFLVKDNQLYLLADDGYYLVEGPARDTRIGSYALSPDDRALAFTAYRPGGTWGLYVLHKTGNLVWLGDQEQIGALAWSPNSENLAFTAQSAGMSQIFVAKHDGQNLRKVTGDSTYKSHLHWSPDGQMIAYITSTGGGIQASTPTPAGPPPHGPYQGIDPLPTSTISAIAVINADGTNPRTFPQDELEKVDLSWGESNAGIEIFYTRPLQDNREYSHLYALDPYTGQSRRVYPPQEITALECPAVIARNGSSTIRVSITNSSKLSADVHVLLRTSSQRFPPISKLNANIVRSESIAIPAGSIQAVDWPVKAQPGLTTHISVAINPDSTFTMDEKRCTVKNTFDDRLSLLPNLSTLSLALPLSAVGLILCVPWLRRQKKRALWFLYLSIPLLVILLILIESWVVWMRP